MALDQSQPLRGEERHEKWLVAESENEKTEPPTEHRTLVTDKLVQARLESDGDPLPLLPGGAAWMLTTLPHLRPHHPERPALGADTVLRGHSSGDTK